MCLNMTHIPLQTTLVVSLIPLQCLFHPLPLSPKLLKHCAPALYSVLHHLFRLCLDQSYIPSDWRMHLITPILKSGDKSQVTNYRPISLLCITSKILERLVYNNLMEYIGNSFSPAQFGFRKRHSTLQQLLSFLFKVYN